MTTPHPRQRAAAALLVLLGAACSDPPTIPSPGSIHVSVKTLGGDPDLDGYDFVVDSGAPGMRRALFPEGSGTLDAVSAGTHTVTLERVAENCSVTPPNPRVVVVMPGQTARIDFEVVCDVTGIEITTRTTGVETPTSLDVLLNGKIAAPVRSNGSEVIGRLQPGTHTIAVSAGSNCTVAGTSPVTVEVRSRTTTPVLFQITCVAPVRLEKIAFVFDSTGGSQTQQWIGLVNPDGTGVTRLIRGHSPTWSPNGTRLLFSTTYCGEWYWYYYDNPCTGALFLIDPEVRNVTEMPGTFAGLNPTWLPTGERFAFRRCCERGFESTHLHSLALDGSSLVDVSPEVNGIRDPVWSPNGERIAFSCNVVGQNWDLCIVDKTGLNLVLVTNDFVYDFAPAWSPDGTHIAFSRSDGTYQQIAILTVGTNSYRGLTSGRRPSWSRDGKTLVFADGGLFTIDADGTNRRRLTTGNHDAPVWRP